MKRSAIGEYKAINMKTATEYRVDYSELVDLLINGFERKAGRLLKEVRPRLIEYLKITMGADFLSAQECVQQAMAGVYEHILKGNIKKPQYIFSYLMRASKNEYINHVQSNKRYLLDDRGFENIEEPVSPVDRLIDQERMVILEQCLDELDEESREFISFFIDNPDTTTREASKHFRLSEANIRTRKSRLTHTLHRLYINRSSEQL